MDVQPTAIGVTHTGTALLEGLRDPANELVWNAYVARYRPMLVRTLEHGGVPTSDAEDLAQLALIEFADGYRAGRYLRDRGRLRSWLFGILKNQARNWRRRSAHRDALLEPLEEQGSLPGPAYEELAVRWEQEWRETVLRDALAQARTEVEAQQWDAFRLFVLEERSVHEVAQRLEISPAKVYSAKRRVLRRVRALRPMLDDLA